MRRVGDPAFRWAGCAGWGHPAFRLKLLPPYFLAKMRLASSRVSLEPMSYQMPGTVQV